MAYGSSESDFLLVEQGLSVVRKATGDELIKKAGELAIKLKAFPGLEVRRPGFHKSRAPAVQLLNNKEVMNQQQLRTVTTAEAKRKIAKKVPSLFEPIHATFVSVNPLEYSRVGHEHYLEIIPDADTSASLNSERNGIVATLDELSSMPLSEAEDLSCWYEHDPKMTLIYCSRNATKTQFEFAKSELRGILSLSCTLEPIRLP